MNRKLFYWSIADEPQSLCDRSRILLWKTFLWAMTWIMLFGGGNYID